MNTLNYAATDSTPLIDFNAQIGVLHIRGESYPENTYAFYLPINAWLNKFFEGRSEAVVMNVQLEYFNSSSSKTLMDMFDLLDDFSKKGCSVTINWIYNAENDVALEHGEEFAEDLESLTFNLQELRNGR